MAGHGSKPLRGLESTLQSSIGTGRFGRMFRWLGPGLAPADAAEAEQVEMLLTELATLMVSDEFNANVAENKPPDAPITEAEPADENPTIPAGYTYLGQFIDHDITFDPASSLQRQNDPDALEDFRTPRLDLDNVYGRGPADQPYLYAKGDRTRFLLGPDRGIDGMDRPDVPRTADGTALIGDKRNDENKIVVQLQALFLKFHNKVYDDLASRFPAGQEGARFNQAQRIVRWCYQWIVLNDYLPKVCDPAIVKAAMPAKGGREPRLEYYAPHGGDAYIPVEFSVAAYRFGHSMVRPSYALNRLAASTATFKPRSGPPVAFSRIPIFVAHADQSTDAMNGFGELSPELPPAWGIDWDFFFGKLGKARKNAPQIPQPSYRIDATLVDPLGALPEFARSGGLTPFASLAFRNLMRGASMGLPSGQQVARMMNANTVLSDTQLWKKKAEGDKLQAWPEGKAFYENNLRWLEGRAPLWFYILKEAEVLHKGHHLGEVGSRIVAETFVGLAWYDHYSYLFQMPQWTPADEGLDGLDAALDMLALTRYVG
jgi:hypothetical protein